MWFLNWLRDLFRIGRESYTPSAREAEEAEDIEDEEDEEDEEAPNF